MPLTSAQRGVIFRKKKGLDPEFKKKEALRQKCYRQSLKAQPDKLRHVRELSKLRGMKHREQVKEMILETSSSSYQNSCSKMRAVYRVMNH